MDWSSCTVRMWCSWVRACCWGVGSRSPLLMHEEGTETHRDTGGDHHMWVCGPGTFKNAPFRNTRIHVYIHAGSRWAHLHTHGPRSTYKLKVHAHAHSSTSGGCAPCWRPGQRPAGTALGGPSPCTRPGRSHAGFCSQLTTPGATDTSPCKHARVRLLEHEEGRCRYGEMHADQRERRAPHTHAHIHNSNTHRRDTAAT